MSEIDYERLRERALAHLRSQAQPQRMFRVPLGPVGRSVTPSGSLNIDFDALRAALTSRAEPFETTSRLGSRSPAFDSDAARLGRAADRARAHSVARAARASGKPIKWASAEKPGDQDDDGGGGGILGNLAAIKDVIAAVPSGLAELAAEAVDSTVGNVGAMVARRVPGVDADRVREEFGPIGRALVNEDTLQALDEERSVGDSLFAALPLGVSLGKSFQATGGRVTDQAAALAPGGKPAGDGAYAEAYSRGQLLPALIEDVGNAALVGSVVARPIAAGASRAAARSGSTTAARVAEKAGQVADLSAGIDDAVGRALLRAPLTLPNKAVGALTGRTIGERIAAGGQRIAGTDRYSRFRESPLATKMLDETFVSPRSRGLGRQIADDRMRAAFDSEIVANSLRDVIRVTGDQPELGIAAMLDLAQVNRLLPDLSVLDEGTFSRLVGEDGALRTLSDAFDTDAIRNGIRVANRYLKDPESLAPDAVAKIDAAAEVWGSRVLPLLEERYLEQVGRRDPVAPETVQMLAGDELLPFEAHRVEQEVRPLLTPLQNDLDVKRRAIDTAPLGPRGGRQEVRRAASHAATARNRLTRAQARLERAHEEAREKVTSAPAKYRTALVFAREMDGAISDMLEAADDLAPEMADNLAKIKAEIVTSTVGALDAMDSPGFLMGGRIDRDGPNLRNVRAAPATKSSGEHTKKGVLGPVAPADQALTIVRDFHRGAATESAKWLSSNLGQRAADLAPDYFAANPKAKGKAVARAISDAADTPLVAWDIRRWSTEEGGNVPLDEITADTVFVPAWAVDAFGNATAKVSDAERLMRDYFDRPTRWWKNGVLALSPTWHAGNMIGNTLMLWAGGVPPSRQLELVRKAKAMIGRAREGEFLPGDAPRRMYGAGQSYDAANTLAFARASESGTPTKSEMANFRGPSRLQRRFMTEELEPSTLRGKARNAALQPIRSSYGLNGWVDDLAHGLVYLDRMKKGADPEVALRDALKVAGDFTNLSKLERQWARRAVPFFSWLKHISRLSADLTINHPLRTAWTLHLWTLANDEDADTFSDIPFLAGSIAIGPTSFLRTQSLMPFGAAMDVGEGGFSDPVGLLGGASNPFLKLGLEGLTGVEAGPNGLQNLSRPFGSGPTDPYGNEKLGPIGWGPFAHRALRILPQFRGARDLLRDEDERVARYDTGQPVTIDGRLLPDINRQDAGEIVARDILRLPVFPPLEANPEEIRARRNR